MLVVATRMIFGRNEGAQSALRTSVAATPQPIMPESWLQSIITNPLGLSLATPPPPVVKTVPLLATGAPRPLGQLPQAIAQMPRAPMAVLTRAPVLASPSAVACTAMMSHTRGAADEGERAFLHSFVDKRLERNNAWISKMD